MGFLMWRDIKVRYKQTVFGVAWAVLQPLGLMVVFAIFFGKLIKVPSQGFPYPVFAYTALVPWTYLSTAVTGASESLIASTNLVTKVYFPRIVVPLASALSFLCDFLIALALTAGLMIWYGIPPTFRMLALIPFTFLAIVLAGMLGSWLSALNAKYRDIRYAIPFLLQVWLFASPVAYPATVVPRSWQIAYAMNPAVGIIEGFRWALIGVPLGSLWVLFGSITSTCVISVFGLVYFGRVDRTLADLI